MPDLLLELFSEEIPARMQPRAMEDLKKLVTDRLVEAGLVYEGAKAFATPRRLALSVHGIPAKQQDIREEKKGPRVGAPEAAIAGFLKSAGLTSLDQAKIEKDPKKGEFYVAVVERAGRPAIEVVKDVITTTVLTFPWPKSMRWGKWSATAGAMTWVRPLHSIVATFGPETEDPEIINLGLEGFGVTSGDTTYGHRFLAPAAITVRRQDDWMAKLEKAKVIVDPERRRQIILTEAKNLAFAQGYELVEDEGLLIEAGGLVEWPVVLMGSFEESFLSIPPEVIRTTIRNNQKCFVVKAQDGALAPRFILVSNMEATDGGKAIVAGNERVIRARLSDAKFFYETDLKTKLEDRLSKFEQIVFHEKLGTQAERIARIEKLAAWLAPQIDADVDKSRRAAKLAKADLLTEVVGEFPELQGLMGKYYALAQGEDPSVASASEDHYKPLGPNDRVPTEPVAIAVALADKIDMLVGFFAIDEKPTGSKDPYALRRAALGVIRTILSNDLRLNMAEMFGAATDGYIAQGKTFVRDHVEKASAGKDDLSGLKASFDAMTGSDLRDFFADRLKVQLREQGARHDLADAVLALPGENDLVTIVKRVEALGKFLETDDGKNLVAGTKRAANILRIEEKKDGTSFTGDPDPSLLKEPEEQALALAMVSVAPDASSAFAREDFAGAMAAMARLRPAVDAFFEKVTVNTDDKALRANRLILLNRIREATRAVADFSKIEG